MEEIAEDELRRYVRQFLIEFKALIDQHGLYVTNRLVNRDALLDLGLTGTQREEIVLSLSVEDYCEGPILDEFRPGNLWVFGKQIGTEEIYIKLKIAGSIDNEHATCISFHKAKHPLTYPFKS